MIAPADDWMTSKGFMDKVDNQGTVEYVPNYDKAFHEYPQLNNIITAIDRAMIDRGFPTQRLKETLDEMKEQAAEDNYLQSKTGDGISENIIDQLAKTAKADIWMKVFWEVKTIGPKKQVTFRLDGIDSYTNKAVATELGTGAASFSATEDVLVEEAVIANMDGFNSRLQATFDKWFTEGREISLRIKTWSAWEYDLESEDFGDAELNILIETWIENNANNSPNISVSTQNQMVIKELRIPMLDEKGKGNDAKKWARGLTSYLKGLGIEAKLMTKGLGQAQLVLGGK
ncbi:MAG: DUF6175 family protein [Flavobacteriales bacterium]|nr:DUF6175 family protein [Flavobacteriales bacterium]